MLTEMRAVDAELQSWKVDDWEAKENMLRGCLGLDVSAFFFMCLVRGLDLIQQQASFERSFDLVRLSDTLSFVLDNVEVSAQLRLGASLNDRALGSKSIELADEFIRVVKNELFRTY
jgi:hypothetical protein